MKKILSILLTVTMVFSLVAAFRTPTAKAVSGITFAASTKTLHYYARPAPGTIDISDTWAYGTVSGTRVYLMGDPVIITASGLAVGTVRAEIYNISGVPTGSYTELYNSVASNTLTFNVPTANVGNDGPYYIKITDSSNSFDTTNFYIQYRLTDPKVNIPQCVGKQATVEGYVTRASGYPLTADVWVWVVDATTHKVVAVNMIPAGQPSGQYFLTWVVGNIGDYRLGISDSYPVYNAGHDYDGMVYKTFSNIPSNYSITVSGYINPILLYKDVDDQPILLKVVDSNGQPVTGLIQADWAVTNATVTDYGEVFPGFYRFEITPTSGAVDVRFKATVAKFTHTYPSNLFIVNLRDRGLFNPYVDITSSDSPYYFKDIATVVYDKLPCEIGFSFDIVGGFWDPVGAGADWQIQGDTVDISVTGPVYNLTPVLNAEEPVYYDQTGYPMYTLGEGSKYYVYDQGDIKVHFEATAWERVNKAENCPISEYNACCHTFTKDVEVCSVVTCPAVTPSLSDGTATVEVGKKTSLKFTVNTQSSPSDLECGCDWKVYMMYMVDADGNIIDDAFTVDTRFGVTKDVSILWYNAVYDKYYAAGGYWLGERTRIEDLFTYYTTQGFGAGNPDLLIHDHCEEVTIDGIVFNYSNEAACGNNLVMKLFGTKQVKGLCGNDYVHPLTYVGINDISIVATTKTLSSTATIWEGTADPSELLAGVIPVIDITDPKFSVDGGVSGWNDVGWKFYFKAEGSDAYKSLTSITVTPSPTDTGYRFSFDKAFSKAGTFKIVGTSYYYDCTKKEVVTLEFKVVLPTFTVKIGLMDGSVIDNDGILTEGFKETVYVTAVDPREGSPHDFSTDSNWTLSAKEALNDCGLATAYVCSSVVGAGCATGLPITIVGYDNPNLADDPMVNLYFELNKAKISITSFKLVPPTVKVDPAEVPFTIPATATHVTFTVRDAHIDSVTKIGHGAPGVEVKISGNTGFSSGASGYIWTATAGITGKTGEVDWAFVPPYSGKFKISATVTNTCELPCGWPGINTSATLEAKYQAPVVDTTKPVVDATAPTEVTAPMVTVAGKVTDNVSVVSLWIGAMKVDFAPDGTFSAKVEVVEGANTIKVVAFDAAGNMGDKTLTVTYKKAEFTVVKVWIGSDIMTVNDKATQLDVAPEIKDGRTFLPLRSIAEALGATVDWIAETKGITVTLGETTIGLQIGNTSAVVNGTVKTLDVAPYIKNGRTMLPFRFIAENLGATVTWDAALRQVTITLAK